MHLQNPLVSIAMATYNGEKFILDQINSILNQSYKNIEIIITDDCSTDNTQLILKELQSKNKQISLFINHANRGVNETFQHSFENCIGQFIAIADQDDIWEENKIELLLKNIENEDAIYSDSELVNERGVSLNKKMSMFMNMDTYHTGIPFLMGNCVPGHSIMLRNDFIKNILPIPNEIMFDRWISFCAAAGNGIKFINIPLVKYRQHQNNTVGMEKSKNKKNKKTKSEKFNIKLNELKVCLNAPITNGYTKVMLKEMIELFHHKLSLKRCIFFFKHKEELLIIKNKPDYRKFLYCIKMFFKPNY